MTVDDSRFEVKNSNIQGKGIFATKNIKKDEVVVVWHPKVLTKEEANKLPAYEQKHYLYSDGDTILWMQTPERYMNHSCNANTYVVAKSDVASRDIQRGEEITSDYLDIKIGDINCNCGATNCRKSVKISK